MKTIKYLCDAPGHIVEAETGFSSMFVTAKKYDVLYKQALPRFGDWPRVYGLPDGEQPSHVYLGTGRDGLDLLDSMKRELSDEQTEVGLRFLEDRTWGYELMDNEETGLQFMSLFEAEENYELIWVRNYGSEDRVPIGYEFLGYDVSYCPDYSGSFSMICDCLFICRYHGCVMEGSLFAEDFAKLNCNGLFDLWQDAYNYMVKYLTEDWTERDEYFILEVWRRAGLR